MPVTDLPRWDTSGPQSRLLSTLPAAIAEFEREIISEGRKRALTNGVKFGRVLKLSDYQRAKDLKRRGAGDTLVSIANAYAVEHDQPAIMNSGETEQACPLRPSIADGCQVPPTTTIPLQILCAN